MSNQGENNNSNTDGATTTLGGSSSSGSARRFFKKNKRNNRMNQLDSKNFSGETQDMNGNLFQTIEESKDATQYVKTVEALERYAFKTYKADLSSLFL